MTETDSSFVVTFDDLVREIESERLRRSLWRDVFRDEAKSASVAGDERLAAQHREASDFHARHVAIYAALARLVERCRDDAQIRTRLKNLAGARDAASDQSEEPREVKAS